MSKIEHIKRAVYTINPTERDVFITTDFREFNTFVEAEFHQSNVDLFNEFWNKNTLEVMLPDGEVGYLIYVKQWSLDRCYEIIQSRYRKCPPLKEGFNLVCYCDGELVGTRKTVTGYIDALRVEIKTIETFMERVQSQ